MLQLNTIHLVRKWDAASTDVYQTELQRYQDQVRDLTTNSYVSPEHVAPKDDEFYEYLYCIETNPETIYKKKKTMALKKCTNHRILM